MRVLLLIAFAVLMSCASTHDGTPKSDLDNLWRVSGGVWSGAEPVGETGFDALETMGVATIISVDAAEPDVARAEARGMRYVHIPMTYGRVDAETTLRLTRAVRDLPRPIYVHCHHGRHRGPTAAALVLVCTGEMTNDEAMAFMARAGTSASYRGLWESVEEAAAIDPAAIDSVGDDELVPVAVVNGLSATMAEMGRVFDHIELIGRAGWGVPSESPDLVPEAEAGRLADLFRALVESDEMQAEPDELRGWMRESARTAAGLETAIVNGDDVVVTSLFDSLGASCTRCHDAYRY